MKRHGYDFMATAHTADDQAETVLLRLLRGSGIRGLSGIAPVRDDCIIRPLLTVQKKALKRWLTYRKLRFREDSSNKNTDFTRNWIRHRFIPVYVKKEPRCIQLLTAVADKAAETNRIMKPMINKWLNRYVVKREKTFFSVDTKGFHDIIIATESIMSLLRDRRVEFDRFHVESIVNNKNKIGKNFLLPSGWSYRPLRETLEFLKKEKKKQKSSFSYDLTIGATTRCRNPKEVFSLEKFKKTGTTPLSFSDPMITFLDAQKIKGKGPLVFRSVIRHEKFWPFGASGYMDVNAFLKKHKVFKYERMSKGVVSLKDKEILWVVGMRTSERFKITPQTKEILKISCKTG